MISLFPIFPALAAYNYGDRYLSRINKLTDRGEGVREHLAAQSQSWFGLEFQLEELRDRRRFNKYRTPYTTPHARGSSGIPTENVNSQSVHEQRKKRIKEYSSRLCVCLSRISKRRSLLPPVSRTISYSRKTSCIDTVGDIIHSRRENSWKIRGELEVSSILLYPLGDTQGKHSGSTSV